MFILKTHDAQKGFTIKELIFVIALLSIFSLVAIPRYVDVTVQTKVAKCYANQKAFESAAKMIYANSILNGTPQYPANLNEIAPYVKSGFTDKCSDGVTPLLYDSATGSVSCPNHPRE
jgi:prepilin-type N-terminal cleavage/methylation domain-containing protein